ncbi:MAG: phage portal protein [Rhodoplanes sp.]
MPTIAGRQIDASVNREFPGGTIVAGIERGPNGAVMAFWVLPSSPDAAAPFTMVGPPVRVDASDICHVFEPRFPGQIRGLSWLHPVATSILELDATQDAAIMKAKVTALMCGFIRGSTDSADLAGGELSMEPGTLRKLPPDADVTFSPTSDMSEINGFLTHMARSISSGVGCPYELVTGDLSNTNYSSARLGLQSFVRRVRAVRSSVLVSRFLQPAWERCITLEVLSGRLSATDFMLDAEPFYDVEFLFPEFASINPLDETKADVEALNAGLRSRAEIIAARGRDFETVNAEIEADTFEPTPQPALIGASNAA